MGATECNAISSGLLGKDPIGFLSKNVVRTGTVSETGFPTSATRRFDFTDDGPTTEGGTVYDHLSPENTNLINGLLEVSYLPWGRDTGYYIILDPVSGPDIMMTAMMSGCSVGYVRANDGSVRVSHHNVMAKDMNQAQRSTLAFATSALHPNQYHHEIFENRGEAVFKSDGFGFVFGVRHDKQWTMYAQTIAVWRSRHGTTSALIGAGTTITRAGVL
jgi:hypothetical protein